MSWMFSWFLGKTDEQVIRMKQDNEREIDKVLEKVDSDLAELGGKVESRDKMGRKKLAFDVQGYRDGFFTNMIVSLPAESIVEFKKNLKLNDNVLRFMFMEVAKKTQTV